MVYLTSPPYSSARTRTCTLTAIERFRGTGRIPNSRLRCNRACTKYSADAHSRWNFNVLFHIVSLRRYAPLWGFETPVHRLVPAVTAPRSYGHWPGSCDVCPGASVLKVTGLRWTQFRNPGLGSQDYRLRGRTAIHCLKVVLSLRDPSL